ncbi:MAG: hypothetical protein V1678_02140, partial [Candidatus Aenigmatarchaeota archaeon]
DQTSYAPGDRIYIKIYVTYSNGSIVPNVNIGGEIFPLIQEETMPTGESILISGGAILTEEPRGVKNLPRICRIYVYPVAPIYYKGEYYPKYYTEDDYIPNDCPVGMYALRLKISTPGYADTEFTKEFDVALHKLLLETGFKTYSRPDSIELDMYAEVKDDQGKTVPYANIKGYLHSFGEECTKTIYFGYDEFTKRYTSKTNLGKYECPAGNYSLEIAASQPSYEAAVVEQAIEVNYSEGFEYGVVVPPGGGVPICKEVSCGPNCVNKICEPSVTPQECYEEVTDKDCVKSCIDESTTAEKAAAEFNVKECMNNCIKKIPCKGSAVTPTQSQEMLDKLEQIREEIVKTREQVNVIQQLIRGIIDFFNSIAAAFGGGQVSPINTTKS